MNIEEIISIVSEETGVSVQDIKGSSRKTHKVIARHISLWACRRNTGTSLQKIARAHNLAQHGTVIHASNNIEDSIKVYQNIADICNKIQKRLN
jgi:chromosomal replication initiator protein